MSSSVEERAAAVGSPRLRLLAHVIFGLTILSLAAGVWLTILDGWTLGIDDLLFIVSFCLFPIIGYVLATRRPDNAISWLVLGIGASFGVSAFLDSYATYALHGGAGGRDLGAMALALNDPTWVPIVGLPATFLILLFPDGHLPSPRWRWFARVLGASLVIIVLAILFEPGPFEDSGFPNVVNPLGIEALRPVLSVALVFIAALPIGVIGSLVALVQRFRRSAGIERLQLRWLVTAAGMVGVLYASALVLSWGSEWATEGAPRWMGILQALTLASFGLIPIAIGVSILRYRLFDIDVVINRALLFGAMAIFITLVYVGIVVGVGALVGSQASPVLSAAAAAVVALAFQPVRRRAQRFADRLVYGKRATPYEVLSEFSERLGNAYANEELLPRMARALAEGTGASRADVWVRIGDELRAEAVWPQDADGARATRRRREHGRFALVVGDAGARPTPRRAPGCAVDHEEAGGVDHRDRGEARPRPGRSGGTRDAQRRAHRAADGHDRRAARVAPAPRDRAGRGTAKDRAEPARRRAAADRRAHGEAAPPGPAGRPRRREGQVDGVGSTSRTRTTRSSSSETWRAASIRRCSRTRASSPRWRRRRARRPSRPRFDPTGSAATRRTPRRPSTSASSKR